MQKYIYVLSNTCQAVKNFQIRLFGIARKSMHFYLPIIPYLCYINKSTLKNMKQNSENPFSGLIGLRSKLPRSTKSKQNTTNLLSTKESGNWTRKSGPLLTMRNFRHSRTQS